MKTPGALRRVATALLAALAVLAFGACTTAEDDSISVLGSWKSELGKTYAFTADGSVSLTIPLSLQGAFIVVDTYNSGATAYALEDIIQVTNSNGSTICFSCSTAGTPSGTDPTWPTDEEILAASAPTTINDGTVVWTYQAAPTITGTWTLDQATAELALDWTNDADYPAQSYTISVSDGVMRLTELSPSASAAPFSLTLQ